MEIRRIQKHRENPSLVTWIGTPLEIARMMLDLAQAGPNDVVYDLGSGDSRILIMAVNDFGVNKSVGYEITDHAIEMSKHAINKLGLHQRIEIVKRNLLEADLSRASVITIYLSSEANNLLRPKLEKYTKPLTRIVTYLFPIHGWQPIKQINLQELTFEEGNFIGSLYLYQTPKSFESGPFLADKGTETGHDALSPTQ